MHLPGVRERVQITGQGGVFLVVAVDRERQVADLIPLGGGMFAEENVPCSKLEPYREELSLGLGHLAGPQSAE